MSTGRRRADRDRAGPRARDPSRATTTATATVTRAGDAHGDRACGA